MVEPTTESTPTQNPAAAAGENASASAAQEALSGKPVGIRDLLEAGVHYGHQTQRWNPKMKSFIYGERNGIHIINLDQSLERFQESIEFLQAVTAEGGRVLFVGTKRQAAGPVQLEAQRAGQFYVNNRWLGGTLTNFRTVKKSIDRFKGMLETAGDQEKMDALSKREKATLNRQIQKYQKSLDGLKEMTRLPDVLVVVDVLKEHIAISEARRLGIPVVAIVDSNGSPDGVDFIIPGNDDAIRAIQLYCSRFADACLEGGRAHNERLQSEEAKRASERGAEPSGPGTGRVVVEIKPPARRSGGGTGRGGGRTGGTHTAGGWGESGEAKAKAASATEADNKAPEPAASEETKDSQTES